MKLYSIHREGIRIYTGAFRSSPVEAYNPPLELRFLHKLKSNTSYIETPNTLDDREDQNYEVNERSIKPMGVYQYRKMEQRYMEEQKEIEDMN